MKIYAISDLHLSTVAQKPMDVFGGKWEGYIDKIKINWNDKIKDEDLVLVAGDISWGMKLDEAKPDLDFLGDLPGTKVIIKGNHEYWWKSISSVREILPPSVKAIQNDAIKFDDVIICGTRGWIVPETNKEMSDEDTKIYKREVQRLKLSLMSAKTLQTNGENIIAMIHFPPFNSNKEQNELLSLFEEYGVKAVIFGHIHGYTNCPNVYENNGVIYYLTSCDHINNDPILIEIK